MKKKQVLHTLLLIVSFSAPCMATNDSFQSLEKDVLEAPAMVKEIDQLREFFAKERAFLDRLQKDESDQARSLLEARYRDYDQLAHFHQQASTYFDSVKNDNDSYKDYVKDKPQEQQDTIDRALKVVFVKKILPFVQEGKTLISENITSLVDETLATLSDELREESFFTGRLSRVAQLVRGLSGLRSFFRQERDDIKKSKDKKVLSQKRGQSVPLQLYEKKERDIPQVAIVSQQEPERMIPQQEAVTHAEVSSLVQKDQPEGQSFLKDEHPEFQEYEEIPPSMEVSEKQREKTPAYESDTPVLEQRVSEQGGVMYTQVPPESYGDRSLQERQEFDGRGTPREYREQPAYYERVEAQKAPVKIKEEVPVDESDDIDNDDSQEIDDETDQEESEVLQEDDEDDQDLEAPESDDEVGALSQERDDKKEIDDAKRQELKKRIEEKYHEFLQKKQPEDSSG